MELDILLDNFRILNQNIFLKQLAIIIIYALFAKITDIFIDHGLRRLAARTSITFDDSLINLLHAPICWTVFCLGILHALVLQPPQPPWQSTLPGLTQSTILLVWWHAMFRLINLIAEKKMAVILSRGKIGDDLFQLLKNLVRVIAFIIGLLWLLAIWNADLTPLFASAGVAGIAVALAAKDSLANFFGGISIFIDRTFKVGDYIVLDSGERGEVVDVGIRSTRIKTRDDVLITIPNSLLANSKIINESAPVPRFRIRIPVGVAYGSNLDQVEEVLLSVAKANPNVAVDPVPRVRLRSFGNSSVDFELLLWVEDPSVRGLEMHNILRMVYKAFAEHNITIPFPQVDVHLEQ